MDRTERRSLRGGRGRDPGSCLTLSVGTPESIRITGHVIESRTGPPTTVRSCNAVTSRCGSRRTRSDPGSPGLRGNEADREDTPRWRSRPRSRYAWSSISHCGKPRASFDRSSRAWGSASRFRITPPSRDAARISASDSVVQLPASPSITSCDSTGLSIVGEGEWAAVKHGKKGKCGWEKLPLGVDRSGGIVARVLTDSNVDDASTGLDHIEQVDSRLTSITGDAAYDTGAIHDAALERRARVVVPPTRTALVSDRGQRAQARDRTIRRVEKLGRREWKKRSGYHRQGTVENAFFCYKSIIGDRLRARHPRGQRAEALLACNVLNRVFEAGRPRSKAIAV